MSTSARDVDTKRRYNRSVKGLLANAYRGMKKRVEGRGSEYESYLYKGLGIMPRPEFMALGLSSPQFKELHVVWLRSGCQYLLTPCASRRDAMRGLVCGNVQFLTRSALMEKTNLWRHCGITP